MTYKISYLMVLITLIAFPLSAYGVQDIEKKDSLFGLGYVALNPPGIAKCYSVTGIRWIKLPDVRWQYVEPIKPAKIFGKKRHFYNWKLLDKVVKEYQRYGFNLQLILRAKCGWASQTIKDKRIEIGSAGITTTFPKKEHIQDYSDFVQAVVERYDGDGKSDMPGLRYPILYYEIESEAQHEAAWQGTAQEYIELLRIANKAAKQANYDAKIILSGFDFGDVFDDIPNEATMQKRFKKTRSYGRRDLDFIVTTLKAKEHYDIIGIHYNRDYKGIFKQIEYIKRFSDRPIWADDATSSPFLLAQGGYYFNPLYPQHKAKKLFKRVSDGDPEAARWFRREQAKLTTKKFVAGSGEGLKKIMMGLTAIWKATPGLGGFHGNFFLTNMVDDDMNPLPVFRTLELLVEKLDGYTSVIRVDKGDNNIYLYKFIVNSNPVYVLWYDDNKNQLPGDPEATKKVDLWAVTGPVKATHIITDLNIAEPFTELKQVKAGILSIVATETPVILERISE